MPEQQQQHQGGGAVPFLTPELEAVLGEQWQSNVARQCTDPTWREPLWLTVGQMVVAFMVGYMEATLTDGDAGSAGWLVPRYMETVCNRLARHLEHALGASLVEISPLAVEAMLRGFSAKHGVVREWPCDHAQACRNAADYLRARAALEAPARG